MNPMRKSRRMFGQDPRAMVPAYKDPNADRDDQMHAANAVIGGDRQYRKAIAVGAAMKNNGFKNTDYTDLDAPLEYEGMDFDTSDADSVGRNVAPTRPGSVRQTSGPMPGAPRQNPSSHLPGLPPERRKNEAAPNDPNQQRRRAPSQTVQLTPQKPQAAQSQAVSSTGKWDVTLPDGRVVRVPAPDATTAQRTAGEWMKQQPRAQGASQGGATIAGGGSVPQVDPSAEVDYKRFQVAPSPNESTAGGSIGAGPQKPLGELGMEAFRYLVNQRLQEIVRKKEGGGGYNLYSPNKGKKKGAKAVGEFPTRFAAKRAELARFPPKDPEALKKARKRLDKMAKDPKKRQEKEKSELTAKKPKRSGRAAGARKARKEAIIAKMANELTERLFHEEELPGSPWDERISGLHPDALAHDKKLHRFHQGMEKASLGALGDGHKSLAKVLRGIAKVQPGDVARDDDRGKMFMPITLDVDGQEIGPVHLYIDGGHVCIEVSSEAREAIAGLEPNQAKDLRGGLMSFQEDHLPKIDKARNAWNERDSYLDKLHQRLEKTVGGLSPIEFHLAKQMMSKRRR